MRRGAVCVEPAHATFLLCLREPLGMFPRTTEDHRLRTTLLPSATHDMLVRICARSNSHSLAFNVHITQKGFSLPIDGGAMLET